jgi:predicted lipoprotein with Yx(FWY)xxD motif
MMSRIKQFRYRIGGIAAVVGVSVLVAACGGSSGGSTTAAASGSAATATSSSNAASNATPAAAKSISISTASGKAGTYLTGTGGRALYLWVADANGMSSCSGACAQAWPPLKGKPTAGKGVTSSDLGTIKRSDGSMQATYKGHPLYYFAGDSGSGTTNGQGSDAFGAKWWLVSPAGAAITTSGSSSSKSGSKSGSGSGSSWG